MAARDLDIADLKLWDEDEVTEEEEVPESSPDEIVDDNDEVILGLEFSESSPYPIGYDNDELTEEVAAPEIIIEQTAELTPAADDIEIPLVSAIGDIVGDAKYNEFLARMPAPKEQPPIVFYTDFCVIKRDAKAKSMSHEDVNLYNFENSALYEVIRDQRYVRPFFDFDTVDSRPKIEKLLDVLDKLAEKWGPYASLGYTNNKDCEDGCLNVTFKAEATKTSFHVYFYEARMSRLEAHKLHTEFERLNSDDFYYDASVYKAEGKQQVFRCPLSFKMDYDYETKEVTTYREKRTECPETFLPEWFIAQVNGKEEHGARFQDLADILGTHAVAERHYTNNCTGGDSKFTFDVFTVIYQGLTEGEVAFQDKSCLTISQLIPALNYFRNDDIGESDVINALHWLEINGHLSDVVQKQLKRQIDCWIDTTAEHPGKLWQFMKKDNLDYYTEKVKPILERVASEKQAEQDQELANIYISDTPQELANSYISGRTHAIDGDESSGEEPTSESIQKKHIKPYTLQTFQASRKSGLHKRTDIISQFQKFIFQVGTSYYIKKMGEFEFVEFEETKLKSLRDLLIGDVSILEVDEDGEPLVKTETSIDPATRLELIRTITAENNMKERKDRLSPSSLKCSIQAAIEAATITTEKQIVTKTSYFEIFKTPECMDSLKKFDAAVLFTSNKRCLQLYIPPTPEFSVKPLAYEPQLAKDYIQLVYDANLYPDPVKDFFQTLAWYIRNPSKKPCRWFIRFSPKEEGGENGKSFMDKIIKLIFQNRAITGISPEVIERDMFNQYDETALYCSINESSANEKSHYSSDKLVARVKRDTDDDGAIRAHQQGMKAGHRYPIWNMNTNESDLNGLTFKLNSDSALKSRLSIQWWRKQNKTPAEKLEISRRFLDNPNMGYSLYRYLLEEMDLNDYTPGRYNNEQKDEIIAALLAKNKSPLEQFTESLMYVDEAPEEKRGTDEPNLYIIRTYQPKKNSDVEAYEYFITTEFITEFQKFSRCKMSAEKLKGELQALGWQMPASGSKKINGKAVRCFTREPQERLQEEDETELGNGGI
jgi:hypothetical protein